MENNYINVKMESTKQEIINSINKSQLPVGAIYYLLKDVLDEVKNLYNQQLNEELKAMQEQQDKQEKQKQESSIVE